MFFFSLQILTQLEGIVLNVIGVILQKNIMGKKIFMLRFLRVFAEIIKIKQKTWRNDFQFNQLLLMIICSWKWNCNSHVLIVLKVQNLLF